ncbi:GvpL/GvpF family gas vesicle protein [Streptomyces sp. SID14478]|uniref:GvpL/GvpF family gas vesicle protein n=1 Tax=Streptomyces sp. SID14478 TaxID=2706073 RepID=UPI0013E0A319|nr:GvpL/GvpF family gas vesicle protein [Streptomyces sp. SID14478]NEB81958.1 GvpL/GvpF family gas vesicle protein [Streptomyces sp. SID14478]
MKDNVPTSARAVCVFAVRRGRGPDLPGELEGHEGGGPLRLLPVGALWAVVQDVPAVDYSQEALQKKLAEPATLERCVRAHHAVVTAFAVRAGAIPLPLATLYHSEERAQAALRANAADFERGLDRISGRREWAVKISLVTAAPAPSGPQATGGDAREPTPGGRAYLARLRERGQEREQRRGRAVEAAELLDRAALSIAAASVRRRLHSAEITGRGRTQIMNTAYLVGEEQERDFIELLERLREAPEFQDCEVEVTGPWVPYSFVDAATPDAARSREESDASAASRRAAGSPA